MRLALLVLALAFMGDVSVQGGEPMPRILLYTRNGLTSDGKRGYIHANIPNSVAAIQKLGAENGFAVDGSDAPEAFTDANLGKYRALVFSNTNNQIFDRDEQGAALQRYIRGGGGFVGIHSTCGSMRNWPWFWALVGGSFVRHPKLQEFTITVVERNHPSTSFFAETFRWTDEFYFLRDVPAGLRVLLKGDLATLDDPKKPVGETTRPLAWCRAFEGGRSWFTTLGHRPETYADPLFQQHILGGILWAMGATEENK